MRYDYRKIKTEKVEVKGIVCEFYDMRIDRATVPDGKYLYEVAGDDDSGAEPARVGKGVLVNFYGSLICNQQENLNMFKMKTGRCTLLDRT